MRNDDLLANLSIITLSCIYIPNKKRIIEKSNKLLYCKIFYFGLGVS